MPQAPLPAAMAITPFGRYAQFNDPARSKVAGQMDVVPVPIAEAQRSAQLIDREFSVLHSLSTVRAGLGNARRYEKDVLLNLGDEEQAA